MRRSDWVEFLKKQPLKENKKVTNKKILIGLIPTAYTSDPIPVVHHYRVCRVQFNSEDTFLAIVLFYENRSFLAALVTGKAFLNLILFVLKFNNPASFSPCTGYFSKKKKVKL